jgi:hypothetical protein
MLVHYDHEEVGSDSAQGAGSSMTEDAMRRVSMALGGDAVEGGAERSRRASFIVSADMAHAVHPNYADKHEPGHKPRFGDGVVIKHNANQRYATDAVTAWLFRELGERAGVPVQVSVFIFTNRVITYSRGTAMGDWTDASCLTLITGVCRSLRPRVRQHHRAYSVHQDRDTDGGRGGAAAVDAQRPRDVLVRGKFILITIWAIRLTSCFVNRI